MSQPSALRHDAQALAGALPALLAEADQLAGALALGEHGRKRAGQGADFWQYRPAVPGDTLSAIDWRRSARSDAPFVREREWQGAQGVTFWVDQSRSMQFQGAPAYPSKAGRAAVLALALASLLLKGGERIALEGAGPARSGRAQIAPFARALLAPQPAEYGAPTLTGAAPHGRAVILSDFLGDLAPLQAALAGASDRGLRGIVMQVLDPVEEAFPFAGRTLFRSMGGGTALETQDAGDLRARYLARLAARKAELAQLAGALGWHFMTHHTGGPALPALLWARAALGGDAGRGPRAG